MKFLNNGFTFLDNRIIPKECRILEEFCVEADRLVPKIIKTKKKDKKTSKKKSK